MSLSPAGVRAHRGSTKYLRVSVVEGVVQVEIQIEAVDVALGIDLPEQASEVQLLARASSIQSWLRGGIEVQGLERCTSEVSDPMILHRAGIVWIGASLQARCSSMEALRLRDTLVFDQDRQHEAFVTLGASGAQSPSVLRHGRQEIALGAMSTATTATAGSTGSTELSVAEAFLFEGALHLFGGFDHLLFLLILLLGTGEQIRSRGAYGASKAVGLWITAFTLGHSVTLALSALEIVALPSSWVEISIALSIALAALANLMRSSRRAAPSAERGGAEKARVADTRADKTRGTSLHRDLRALLALGVGLIHGLGFSGVLLEMGLPSSHRLLALACFNVGIEAAQLSVLALLIAPLALLSQRPVQERRAASLLSLMALLIAFYWALQRAQLL